MIFFNLKALVCKAMKLEPGPRLGPSQSVVIHVEEPNIDFSIFGIASQNGNLILVYGADTWVQSAQKYFLKRHDKLPLSIII